MIIIFSIVGLIATTIGALTGLGGGLIIKPILNMITNYNAETIGLYSSLSVFFMALTNLIFQEKFFIKKNIKAFLLISYASILGGVTSVFFLDLTRNLLGHVGLIQNILLALLIVFVFIYFIKKPVLQKEIKYKGFFYFIIGFFLGLISSFLSIGGGPLNILAFMYFFKFTTSESAVSSVVVIFFSQISVLLISAFNSKFTTLDLEYAPYLIVAAIIGGFLGKKIKERINEKVLQKLFLLVLFFVLLITLYNIFFK